MKILYLCRGNVGRSQMAEAFHRKIYPKDEVSSAGTLISDAIFNLALNKINGAENVVEAMNEEGIDVSKNKTKSIPRDIDKYDKIIVMAESETIPDHIKNNNGFQYWEVKDPKGTNLETHKTTKNIIKQKILELK